MKIPFFILTMLLLIQACALLSRRPGTRIVGFGSVVTKVPAVNNTDHVTLYKVASNDSGSINENIIEIID